MSPSPTFSESKKEYTIDVEQPFVTQTNTNDIDNDVGVKDILNKNRSKINIISDE